MAYSLDELIILATWLAASLLLGTCWALVGLLLGGAEGFEADAEAEIGRAHV